MEQANLKNQLKLDASPVNPDFPVSSTTDGNYGPLAPGICMASIGANTVWWRGTLPSKARIQKIDIVFGKPDLADGFALWISNDTGIPSGDKCYEDVDVGFPNLTQNITSCNRTGLRVMIVITRTPPQIERMGVCEVDIYGCFTHKYGDQCQFNCTNCKHGCDPDNGVCDSTHCNAGWTGTRFCNQTCSSLTFGENCLQECHCKTPGCNGETGHCNTAGCQAGYHGSSCSQGCDSYIELRFLSTSHLFENCSSTCNCDTPGCDLVTGHCNVPGCVAGWKGESCNITCFDGVFGKGCNTLCHCAVPGCDKADGTCTNINAGCLDGWNGSSCSQACVSPYFGNKCTSQCRCKTFGCNHANGTCTIPGCISGWKGTSCSTQCPTNMFGKDCLLTCHCMTPGCSRFNGTCMSSDGCSDGYIGSSCSTKCKSGHFGANCTKQCRCKDAACSHVTGNCSSSGCLPGWRGDTCSMQCSENKFGEDCLLTCHCNTPGCSHFNGTCLSSDGCSDGYIGSSCSTKCKSGHFGANCTKQCRCKDAACSHVTGNCSASGCLPGWRGDTCSEQCQARYHGAHCDKICPHDCNDNFCIQINGYCAGLTDTDNINTAAVGIGVGCGMLILVLVILVIVQTRRLAMKHRDNKGPIQMSDILQHAKRHELKADIDGLYEVVDTKNGRQISKSATADENYEKLDSLTRTVPNVYDTVGIAVDAGS
ncbi:multiple epidermal growth factor-like domains protein 10 [Mizuhopecten yessoensis]|uniref:multiple epidermal growth factor-like domains protein 10 n=1 Tax=Mizuhopecten yessoensis TaxID=6573 RepID=UPI000B45BB8C|nr:multiple epidermal growth factor-like domains protein 10 [Mizuhopecten yessoensis]